MADVRHSARSFLKKCDFDESSIELRGLEGAHQHHKAAYGDEKPVRLKWNACAIVSVLFCATMDV
jgi:hypothetical protein